MAGGAPKTESWTARENQYPKGVQLFVRGRVEVGDTNKHAKLTKASGQNPGTLVLDLARAQERARRAEGAPAGNGQALEGPGADAP